ncbi:MAG: RHS repeat-associated core domain-containing protein [Niastella sp.]|uniref:RHS repeat-associated core domain-containing protein n=1 Tax=Niastella sp. TaxID=1869183 RepID=UPI00389A217C
MYVANTHLKPVIGIDIHFVNLPFPFIPLPHPYIGLVIDPFDYLPFIGATVKVNHVPRGNTDTMGMIITFVHIPFGAGFTLFPMIGHDSQNFFGSKTVSVDGAPMSGAGYMLMTCNDIGIPLSLRPGKKFIPIPSLYLPTSFCIPLQWGKPVMVGGPLVPNFSLMALLKAFAFGSFLKIFGKLGGKLLKALNNKLLKRSPATKKLSAMLCKMGFEPVDLITGRVNVEHTDFELPGPIPLSWVRNWDSDSAVQGQLGHGVHHCYDRCVQIWPEEGGLSVTMADGRLAVFPLLYYGEGFYHPQEKVLLRRKQNGHFLLEDYNESLYYHFNHQQQPNTWQLSFIENYSGNRIQLHYTGGYISAITDSAGRQLLFTLNKQHRITAIEVHHRSIQQTLVNYQYNEEGDLIAITDALNQAVTIEYQDHLMVKKTDRNGQSFYWEYDAKQRCVHTWGDGGVLEGFIEYHKGYNLVTNSLGETSTYYFDENNLCVQETDHYGNHKYIYYTEDFDIYREIDEAGNITGYAYDEKSRLKEQTLPDGSTLQFLYNDFDQPALIVQPDGSSQSFGYDDMRRLSFINHPNGRTITLQYNSEGQVETIIENGNLKTALRYDEDENLTRVQLPDGTYAEWKYDALGRCIQSINPDGQIRYLTYDELNRVQTIHLPDGNTIRLQYNAYEDIVHARDKHTSVQYEYTPIGNVKKRRQENVEMQFLYDTEERLRTVINESGRHYSLDYNNRGEITSETGFDGIQSQYERDATGLITKAIRPGDRSTKYEYDANGNITRLEYHDGSWELFSYDKNGNLQEAMNEHSTVRFNRNKLGLIVAEEQDSYKVESTYDKWGNRTRLTSSLGADMLLKRNETGQVTQMQADTWQAQMKYNQAGTEIERLLPGDLCSEWKYDQGGRPAEHKLSRRGVVQRWKKYTWGADNRLTDIFDTLSLRNTHFKHDTFGNLVFAQYASNNIMHRTADATGNIYETTDKSDRRYNSAGAPLESDKYLYKYDEEGYLVSKTDKLTQKKTRYTWYAKGLLKNVQRPDGKTVEYTYDALGRRLSKSFDGTITRWVWHANTPLHEWSYRDTEKSRAVVNEWGEMILDKEEPNPQNKLAGVKGITWVFEDDSFVPCAKIEDGNTYSIIADYLGTPVAAYDATGKRVWECALDMYGRASVITGSKNFIPFRYQGQYEDEETGLYYNRFRYYNPHEGLYISKDPLSVLGGFNVYSYAYDPNSWIDAFGLINNTPIGDAAEDHFRNVLTKNGWKVFPDIKNGSQNGLDIVAQHPTSNAVYVFEVKANSSQLSRLQKDPEKYIADRLTEASRFGTICGKQTAPGVDRAARNILREIDKNGMKRYVLKYKVTKRGNVYDVKLKKKGVGVQHWVKC